MKHKLELKVQASLDGELSEKHARRVNDWIANDPEAGSLAAHLASVKHVMLRNEPDRPLSESREFYWSKIQSQIQRQNAVPHPAALPGFARWRRLLIPAGGIAILTGALVLQFSPAHIPAFDVIADTSAGMDAVTFHDQSAHMTFVFLQDDTPVTQPGESLPDTTDPTPAPAPTPDDSDSGLDLE